MMNHHIRLQIYFLVYALAWQLCASADEQATQTAEPAAAKSQHVCLVTGERLVPGQTVEYVYRKEGQPDRALHFCCTHCLARFKADPERYLRKLERADGKPEADGGAAVPPPDAH